MNAIGRIFRLKTIGRRYASTSAWVTPRKGDKVVVAMSGGVDSSVAAALMSIEDYDLSAIFMRNWDKRDESGTDIGCQWERDWEDVQRVCKVLDLPVRMIDLSQQYWNRVFEPSLDEWQRGITPNPDVPCNREVKFGALMDHALQGLNEWLVTGHYARTRYERSSPGSNYTTLVRAKDHTKDQSYFLSSVRQSQLARAFFPLGGLLKTEVRELARKHKLPTAERPESMGLCFVGQKEGRIDRFLAQYMEPNPGPILDEKGQAIGRHQGLWTFTIGQGARIQGQPVKLFVAAKDVDRNALTVVPGSHHPMLYSRDIQTIEWNWIAGAAPKELLDGDPLAADVKVCHGERKGPCTAIMKDGNVTLRLDDPMRGVTPGQYAVLYQGDVCLGSSKILSTTPVDHLLLHNGEPRLML